MIALSILFVLGVVVGAIQFSLQSSHKQFHHAYYNEKSLALIDGVNAIARGKAQDRLVEIIEAQGKKVDITEDVVALARALHLWRKGSEWEPTIEVSARVDPQKLKYFAADDGSKYQSIQESVGSEAGGLFAKGNEVEGLVEIETRVGFSLPGTLSFIVPKRTVQTEYEFKRILRTPRFFRQFALYVKEAGKEGEKFDEFAGRVGYNRVANDMRGFGGGGAIFISPGGGVMGQGLPKAEGNPFQNQIGYLYLGGEDPVYLNLAAGNDDAEFSESFQLYQGATTNFYKVWDTDFSSFMEEAKKVADGSSQGGGGFFSRAWTWLKNKLSNALETLQKMIKVLDQLDELEVKKTFPGVKSSGLPLYYFVRKDYGYAKEWGQPQYAKFGFGLEGGQDVYSSGLKLFGVKNGQQFQRSGQSGDASFSWNGSSAGASLVLGKVYRRVLSLGGYKQRRGDDDPSTGQSFEVQAGPIEYFKSWKELVKKKHFPLSGGGAPPEAEQPIWVWDARVDWNRHEKAVNGTWYPISGWGLAGRLLPAMSRFWVNEDQDKVSKLFEHSLMPPRELSKDATPEDVKAAAEAASKARGLQDFPDRIQGGISPMILTLYKKGFFAAGRNGGPWIDAQGAPYFEELLRCFAYASYLTPEEMEKAVRSGDPGMLRDAGTRAGENFTEEDVRGALLAGHAVWSMLKNDPSSVEMPSEAIASAYPGPSPGAPSKGDYWAQTGETDAADKGRYPFSLPDPWSNESASSGSGTGGGSGSGGTGAGGAAQAFPKNFQKAFEAEYGGKEDDVFDAYLRPVMTNPARVQPYNYSMRYMFDELKELFGKGEAERAELLAQSVAPEVREGIGYRVKGQNDWLAEVDDVEGKKFDRALDDELLKKIHTARKGDAYLKKGFFFMDEYGPATDSPAKAQIDEPYHRGARYCWDGLTDEEFRDRFGPSASTATSGGIRTVNFGNVVRTAGDCTVFADGATFVRGGGVLVVPGTVTIGGSVASDKPLTIVADKVVFRGDIETVKAMIVAKDVEFGSSSFVLSGALATGKWNAETEPRSGRILVAYDSALKSAESFVHVIEPRIHRMSIMSGEGDP